MIDASVTIKLVAEEEDTDCAISLAGVWAQAGVQIAAPYFMLAEVTNGLLKKTRRGEITPEEARLIFERISAMGIDFRQPVSQSARAVELALALRQSDAYDSHYLALAEILDCEFWTADRRFYNAANNAYPRVRWIGEIRPEATAV